MNQKYLQNMHHANVNVSLMVENATPRIKSGITINAGVSAKIKKKACVQKR